MYADPMNENTTTETETPDPAEYGAAIDEGRLAALAGVRQNPYSKDSWRGKAWRFGWRSQCDQIAHAVIVGRGADYAGAVDPFNASGTV